MSDQLRGKSASLLTEYRVACTANHPRDFRYCGWTGYRLLPAQARTRYEEGTLRLAPCPRCDRPVKPLSPKVSK